jgi:outer membrane protein assembly factor BamB
LFCFGNTKIYGSSHTCSPGYESQTKGEKKDFPKDMVFLASHYHLRAFKVSQSGTLEEMWDDQLEDIYTLNVESICSGDGKVFVGTRGRIFCYDPSSGARLWKAEPDVLSGILKSDLYSISLVKNFLIVAGNNYLVCLNTETGEELWTDYLEEFGFIAKFQVFSTCVFTLEGAAVIAIATQGRVILKNLITRKTIWENGLTGWPCCFSLNSFLTPILEGFKYGKATVTLFEPKLGMPLIIVGISGFLVYLKSSDGTIANSVSIYSGLLFHPAALLTDDYHVYVACFGELSAYNANAELVFKNELKGFKYQDSKSICFANDGNILIGTNALVGKFSKDSGNMVWKGSESLRWFGWYQSILPVGERHVISGVAG